MTRMKALLWLTLGMASIAIAQQDKRTWADYGGGPDSSKYVALSQITKSNVNQLQVAWSYSNGDSNAYLFNPIVIDNVMYVLARNSSLVALDATTGKEIWIHANLRGIANRGINYWESKDRKDRRLIFQINHNLEEIDAATGKSILTFGNKGLVSLKEGLGRDPKTISRIQSNTPGRVFENLIILGSAPGEGYLAPPGDIRAYDILTGKMAWSFHTIPHPGEFGYETWPKDAWKYSGAANTWGELTLDDKRGIVYLPTGSATFDYYGADRIGSDLFADCLLALDARTGKRLWHFQMVHHDLWDYDATSAPQLVTVRHNGKTVDAVAQASKQGFLYVFDRVSGAPLWPIEERPVPKSTMPGEQAWPTQPFPTAPPPFARQKMTPEEVSPYLPPEERAMWKDRIASAGTGLFTPPSTKETFALPGARGGSNWGTTAANPSKGLVYVLAQDWPSIYKLSTDAPSNGGGAARGGAGGPGQTYYQQRCQSCHGATLTGTATAPPLAGATQRLGFESFKQVVMAGRGEMPAFSMDEPSLNAIFAFIGGASGGGPGGPGGPGRGMAAETTPAVTGGPVVASGGAPGGLDLPAPGGPRYIGMEGPPYPEGVAVPPERYYTGYGLSNPQIIRPPWSSLVAYDLNAGTIKWKVPLGEDPSAANGDRNTGVQRGGERHGMVITATGLIFATARDARVRAFDEETGKVLWTAELPTYSEGLPAMYEANGRQFLVVPASGISGSGGGVPIRESDAAASLPKGYVVFALPEKARASK